MKIGEFPKAVFIGSVKGYQYLISPLLPPSCRFTPTCSAYTIQAVEKYGVIRGAFMGLFRLLRCHPFSRGGYDPVQ
ncbi:MAG: membrane protein insertion efficiency factor YidD [Desulfobulbaceae bacterium]|nr:membrane protein insertion efficiency factor YidD [Desulfobulbaceae bacterium]